MTEIAGIVKDVWADDIKTVGAGRTPIMSRLPLSRGLASLGGVYHQPVMLAYEGSFTTAPGGTAVGTATNPYNRPIAGSVPDAEMTPYQFGARSRIDYEAIARTANALLGTSDFNLDSTENNTKKAVKAASATTMESLGLGTAKKVEILALHGQRTLGIIESIETSSRSGNYNGVAGNYRQVSITPSSWSRGLWSRQQRSAFDVVTLSGATPTKTSSAANTLLGNNETGLILTAVSPSTQRTGVNAQAYTDNRVLEFWHTATTNGIDALAVDSGLVFEGCVVGSTWQEMPGLTIFGRNTGTLFAINAETFDLWRGNIFDAAGNINLASLIDYCAALPDFDCMSELVTAIVPSRYYMKVASDEAALRRYSGDYFAQNLARSVQAREGEQQRGQAMNGFGGRLMFGMDGDNTLELLSHPYQKQGEILVYVPSETKRVGAQDISTASKGGSRMVLESADAPSSEIRVFGSFVNYVECPRHCISITGITY
ncbi:MAG: hypothetical protein SFW67_35575 [Myxococcaceae bacterium]|nr:hypothetical protein [Myxococcaceae bacterium]